MYFKRNKSKYEAQKVQSIKKYGQYVKKQNREIQNKIKELLHDGQIVNYKSQEQSFVMANDNHQQEFLEDLEEEFGQAYQESKVKINIYVKLLAYNPFLSIRKYILIQTKLASYYAYLVTTHPIFEVITLIMIVFNSVMLAIDDPTTNIQLILYTAETILKIGFIIPKNSYLRDTWNILDFSVTTVELYEKSLVINPQHVQSLYGKSSCLLKLIYSIHHILILLISKCILTFILRKLIGVQQPSNFSLVKYYIHLIKINAQNSYINDIQYKYILEQESKLNQEIHNAFQSISKKNILNQCNSVYQSNKKYE